MKQIKWEKIEPGWSVADQVGGCCKEHGGWKFHPVAPGHKAQGPFRTLKQAQAAAEKWLQSSQEKNCPVASGTVN